MLICPAMSPAAAFACRFDLAIELLGARSRINQQAAAATKEMMDQSRTESGGGLTTHVSSMEQLAGILRLQKP